MRGGRGKFHRVRYRHVTQGMSRLEDAVSGLELHLAEQEFIQMAGDSLLVLGMATCNELNIIKDVIHGASLDEKKFSSTGWSMELEGEDQESAQLDQLSVPHVRSMIQRLCRPETILADFDCVLERYVSSWCTEMGK